MTRLTAANGFILSRDGRGYRLDCEMPGALAGEMSAYFLLRGEYLDSTDGIPSRIEKSIAGLLGGDRLIAPWQVHGTAIAESRALWALPQRVKADGVHLDSYFDPGAVTTSSLRFADCAPIVLASDYPRPWMMILHSGFRGTTEKIFESAWRRALSFYKTITPEKAEKVYVWIGPAVGPCCYSRRKDDPSTAHALTVWDEDNLREENGMVFFDIHGEIEGQAKRAGIPPGNIFRCPLCTSCNSDIFYSYRAGDISDRMILLAKLRKNKKRDKMPQIQAHA